MRPVGHSMSSSQNTPPPFITATPRPNLARGVPNRCPTVVRAASRRIRRRPTQQNKKGPQQSRACQT